MFKKGDTLRGTKKQLEEAHHPIIYIDGPEYAPHAVVMTHSQNFACNFPMADKYDNKPSYFVAHLVEKLSEWGPYKKIGEITKNDLKFIESSISGPAITWKEYEQYTKISCPDHK